jgi:hypothetical protein
MRDLLAFVKSFSYVETRAQDVHFHMPLELNSNKFCLMNESNFGSFDCFANPNYWFTNSYLMAFLHFMYKSTRRQPGLNYWTVPFEPTRCFRRSVEGTRPAIPRQLKLTILDV